MPLIQTGEQLGGYKSIGHLCAEVINDQQIAVIQILVESSVIYFSASGLFDTLARYAFDSRAKEALSGFYEDLYNCDLKE